MKTDIVLVLTAITATICWNTVAQIYDVPVSLRVVNGQIYNVYKSVLWKSMDGNIVKISTNGIVVQTFTLETKQQAVVVRKPTYASGLKPVGYHDETQMVNV
jgi:hypothetical protein